MKRIVLILVLLFSTPITYGQSIAFEEALNHLYFGVDIFKARGAIVFSHPSKRLRSLLDKGCCIKSTLKNCQLFAKSLKMPQIYVCYPTKNKAPR